MTTPLNREDVVTGSWAPRLSHRLHPPRLDVLGLDRRVLAAFIGSRMVILVAALLGEYVLTRNPLLTSGDNAPLLRSLTSWDGWFYLEIVRGGYHALPVASGYHDYAFFPLYPAAVWVLSFPWPSLAGLVAVLVSNALLLVGLALLAKLGQPYLGADRASLAAAYLAVFPFAFVFAMSYSEALFLVLMVASFLAAERRHRAIAGLLFALCCLTRLQGVVLVIPLLLLILRQDSWRPRLSLGWLLLGPAATLAFIAYAGALTGGASTYLQAQADWSRTGLGSHPVGARLVDMLSTYNVSLLAILSFLVFLLVFLRADRIPAPYAILPLLFLIAGLTSGLLEAIGRIGMAAFPYVWILARRKSRIFQTVWPVVSLALLAILSIAAFRGYFVP